MVARVVANKTVVAIVVALYFYAQKIACTSGCKKKEWLQQWLQKKGVVATVVAKIMKLKTVVATVVAQKP